MLGDWLGDHSWGFLSCEMSLGIMNEKSPAKARLEKGGWERTKLLANESVWIIEIVGRTVKVRRRHTELGKTPPLPMG